jgi:hypothetical protein
VRNGYDLLGLKLSSKTKESPGRRLGLMFFHESKKFRNPGFLSHCGAVPLLLWKRLLRIGYIGYSIIKGLIVFWFLLLLSLYEFYNSALTCFLSKRVNSAGFGGRNCLSQMRKIKKMSEAFRVFLPPMLLILLASKVWRTVLEISKTWIASNLAGDGDYLSITIGMTTGVRPVRR